MPLTQDLNNAQRLITGAGTLAGLVVPAGVMLAIVDLPKDVGQLAALLATIAGIAVVLLVMILGDRIRTLAGGLVALMLAVAGLGGAALAVHYHHYASDHVLAVPPIGGALNDSKTERYILPHDPSPIIRGILSRTGGDYGRALRSGARRVMLIRLDREEGPAIRRIVAYFVLAQMLLVFSIVSGAWWLVGRMDPAPANPPADR